MPYAVTHILVPVIFLELLRDNSPKISRFFTRKHTFLVGLAGALPDMDVPIYAAFKSVGVKITMTPLIQNVLFENFWLTISFSAFFLLFYYLVPKLKVSKKAIIISKKFGKIFLVLFIAWSIHIILDAYLTGEAMPFYPLSTEIINYDIIGRIASATGIEKLTILVSIDALLIFFWLWHEEAHHYIKDYF